MSAPLAPALSAEEWTAKEKRTDAEHMVGVTGDTVWIMDSTDGAGSEDHHALMALANHALPDTHPGKITRGDVGLLIDLADMLPRSALHESERDHLRALAAKLAALLPPEG